jgi:hypothetical protein
MYEFNLFTDYIKKYIIDDYKNDLFINIDKTNINEVMITKDKLFNDLN